MSRRPVRAAALAGAPLALAVRPRAAALGVEEAASEAEAVLAAARAEADAIRADAWQDGYAEGLAEGRAAVGGSAAALADLLDRLEAAVAAAADEAAEAALPLALEVAAKLVRAEVAARPEHVIGVLRGAIRRATSRDRLVAHVNPADLAICRDAVESILAGTGGIGRLEVMDDPRIGPGSCVLETGGGDVDATFESQLARILGAVAAPPDEELVEPRA